MAVGKTRKLVGSVGMQGKKSGSIGMDKTIHGNKFNPDMEYPKVGYPTTTTTV